METLIKKNIVNIVATISPNEIKEGIRYVIHYAPPSSVLCTKDQIKLEKDGDLCNYTSGGWYERETLPYILEDVKLKIDTNYYVKERKKLQDKIHEIDSILYPELSKHSVYA